MPAPYKIARRGGEWVVLDNAGSIKAKFGQSKDKARAYQKALYANVKGAAKKAEKTPWTGKEKVAATVTGAALSEVLALAGPGGSDALAQVVAAARRP